MKFLDFRQFSHEIKSCKLLLTVISSIKVECRLFIELISLDFHILIEKRNFILDSSLDIVSQKSSSALSSHTETYTCDKYNIV